MRLVPLVLALVRSDETSQLMLRKPFLRELLGPQYPTTSFIIRLALQVTGEPLRCGRGVAPEAVHQNTPISMSVALVVLAVFVMRYGLR